MFHLAQRVALSALTNRIWPYMDTGASFRLCVMIEVLILSLILDLLMMLVLIFHVRIVYLMML